MKGDIDEILSHYLSKELLTDEEKLMLEEWQQHSRRNEAFGKMVRRLESQKRILDGHQKQEVAFERVRQHVCRQRERKRVLFWSSCATGIVLLAGVFLFLQQETRFFPRQPNHVQLLDRPLEVPPVKLILPSGKKRELPTTGEKVITLPGNRTSRMRTSEQTLIVQANESPERAPEYYTVDVPLKAKYNVLLSDGTKVYLNAGSSLRYPDHFAGELREVFLEGEGYFEVVADTLHPFIVRALDIGVRVLGTSFNINAYPDGEWIKTTLVQGKVEARCDNTTIIMSPDTQVAYHKERKEINYIPVNTADFTSWKEGYYNFEEMPLKELMQIFTRWYGIKIEFAQPELGELRFSGRLKRYDDVKSLFNTLEYTRDIKFVVMDDHVIIQKRETTN